MIIKTPKGNLASSQSAILESDKVPMFRCPRCGSMYHNAIDVVSFWTMNHSLDTIFPEVPTNTSFFSGSIIGW